MNDLKLVSFTDPILKTPTEPFSFENPPCDPHELVKAMDRLMMEKQGLGLAAPQVGLPYAMFITRGEDEADAYFNPSIVAYGEEEVALEEGCLSYPGLFVKITRPKHVRIRYQDATGEAFTNTFTGMTARCIIHEMEHLHGIVFYENADRYHREKALRKWRRLKKIKVG